MSITERGNWGEMEILPHLRCLGLKRVTPRGPRHWSQNNQVEKKRNKKRMSWWCEEVCDAKTTLGPTDGGGSRLIPIFVFLLGCWKKKNFVWNAWVLWVLPPFFLTFIFYFFILNNNTILHTRHYNYKHHVCHHRWPIKRINVLVKFYVSDE